MLTKQEVAYEIDKELDPDQFTIEALLAKGLAMAMEIETRFPLVREPFKIIEYKALKAFSPDEEE